jgi:hypothetical protein
MIHPRRWRIVRSIRRRLGLPCLSGACVRSGQWGAHHTKWCHCEDTDLTLRDRAMTWPSLTLGVEVLPWNWEFRWWQDWDMTSSFDLRFLFLRVAWFANRPMFRDTP